MGQPNTNDDDLAPLLRDKLMPLRMWWLKSMPGAMKQMRNALEHKKLGAPGGYLSPVRCSVAQGCAEANKQDEAAS
jgi:hypothetical protein